MERSSSRIRQSLDALREVFSTMDTESHWPLGVGDVAPYFNDLNALDLIATFREIEDRGLGAGVIAGRFGGPTVLRQALLDVMVGFRLAKLPLDEQVWGTTVLLDVVESAQAGDALCRDGINAVWGRDEIERRLPTLPWTSVDAEGARACQRLATAVWAWLESVYFYPWINVGFEIHGPYGVEAAFGPGTSLLVRDYFDVRPSAIWGDLDAAAPDSVALYAVYRNLDVTIDMFGHVRPRGQSRPELIAHAVHVDGRPVTVPVVEALSARLVAATEAQAVRVASLPALVLRQRFIEVFYYCLRPFRLLAGRAWAPPPDVVARLAAWGVIESPKGKSDPQRVIQWMLNALPGPRASACV